MSWLTSTLGDIYDWGVKNNLVSLAGRGLEAVGVHNDVADWVRAESSKKDLRGTEIATGLNGLPIIGDVTRGIEGINQLEDLYNRTGKTVAYSSQTSGASGLGHALAGITRKIEDGSHDLGEYYAGESLPVPSSTDQLLHGWNQRNYHIRKW